MPQAAPHRGRASFANGQNFREVGLCQATWKTDPLAT